jgi:MFS family permease
VIYRQTGDAALVGLFGAVRVIPYVVLSIPAGVVADRFDRRLVLLASDVWRGSVMVLIALLLVFDAPVLPIAALAILATCGSAFFYPAMGAYVPNLVTDERQLGPANSAWSSLDNLSFILGPAIGGLLLALGAVTVAFVLNALTFVVVAVILWGLPPSTNVAPAAARSTKAAAAANEASSGTNAASSAIDSTEPRTASTPAGLPASQPSVARRPLVGIGIIQALDGFFDSGLQTLTVILAINVLQAGEAANGYLNAAIGVGGLLGAIGSGVLVLRRDLGPPLIIGAIVFGVGLLFLGAVPLLVIALVAIAVANAGALIIDVVMTTVFQRVVPDELRGRWIGIFMSVNTLVGAAGAMALPILVVNIGAAPTLGAAALAVVMATLAGLAFIGRAATRAPSRFEATLAEVAKLPLFAGVPAARLEAALAHLREVPVPARHVVVTQGDPADRFFMIVSGTFVVTQAAGPGAPAAVLRRLGANQVFGELGLLHGSPRTATVTAETDGVLLELDGADFLQLVGAGGQLRSRLLGLYAGAGSSGTS